MSNLFGTNPNQVPLNSMLGNLAFQDKAYVSVDKVGVGTTFVDSGTAGQILQVYGGGAYVSGSVGVGTTNPADTLDVVGIVRPRLGIRDSFGNVGTAGSVLISTGAGVSWTSAVGSGAQGAQGTQGLQGFGGSQGLQGLQGFTGGQGVQGTQGLSNQGAQGLQSSQGTQGLQGLSNQGSQGTQGIQGIQGSQGRQGLQGTSNQGFQGLQGIAGPVGSSFTINNLVNLLYSDETEASGSSNTNSIKSYSVAANTHNYIIVESEVGIDATTLDAEWSFALLYGGVTKETIPLRIANTGTGDQFKLRATVKYAEIFTSGGTVQIDVASVGTAAGTWQVHSFRVYGVDDYLFGAGPQGAQGIQATQGLQGTQGTQGLQGIQGSQGRQGIQGLQASQGTQGLQGLQNSQGTQGLQGIQASQGTQGLQGLQNSQGTQGLQGIQASQGLQGTQGTQGVQGIQGPIGDSYWESTIAGINTVSNVGIGSTIPAFKLDVLGDTRFTGIVTVVGGLNAPLYIDESEDDNAFYNIPFLDTAVVGGDTYRLMQVDTGGLRFNPGVNVFSVLNIQTPGLLLSLGSASGKYGIGITDNGDVGIGTTSPTQKLDVFGTARIRGGLYDFNNNVGAAGSVLISTGAGISWTTSAGSGAQGAQGLQGLQGLIGFQGIQGLQGLTFQGLQGASGGGGSGSLSVNDDTTSDRTVYVALSTATSGPVGLLTVSSTKLIFNPSSGTLTGVAATFTASPTSITTPLNLTGTASASNINRGVISVGGTVGFEDQGIIGNFVADSAGYTQIIVQNKNSSSSSSADVIVNNDRPSGALNYGDFGINSSGFTGSGPFNDPNGTYLYSSGGTLTVGTINAHDVRFATNNILSFYIDYTNAVPYFGSAVSSIALTNPIAVFTANVAGYNQVQIQNQSSGATSSIDYIASTDTATDTAEYIDLGINGSGYVTQGLWGPKDGYLYVQAPAAGNGGHLILGTAGAAGRNIVFHTGGTATTNERMRIQDADIVIQDNVEVISGSIYGKSLAAAYGMFMP